MTVSSYPDIHIINMICTYTYTRPHIKYNILIHYLNIQNIIMIYYTEINRKSYRTMRQYTSTDAVIHTKSCGWQFQIDLPKKINNKTSPSLSHIHGSLDVLSCWLLQDFSDGVENYFYEINKHCPVRYCLYYT